MILHRYFALRYLKAYLGVTGGFFLMLALIDIVEQLRRYGGQADIWQILWLTFLNIPPTLYLIFPLLVMIASLVLFLGLARSSELVVARAAGRSALVAMVGPLFMVLVIGAAGIVIFNPIVAGTTKAYEAQTEALSGGQVQISENTLWWRQGDADGQTVIRAQGTNLDGTHLRNATFLRFTPSGEPFERIEAEDAILQDQGWHMKGVTLWPIARGENPALTRQSFESYALASTLTPDQIRDSFGTPDAIPVWELPAFIQRLQSAGFSARRYEMHLQNTLSLPLFLVAMMLVSAIFTLRHQRGGRTGIMVLSAVALSFSLYFIRNLAQILGENGQIPVWLAAWSVPAAAVAFALGWLLHLEDG